MKNAVRIICGIALLSSLAFASASGEVSDSLQNRLSVDLGVSLEGAFGLWNVKLEEDHIRTPEFGFGVSSLWGIGLLAFRISALGKYQAVYVSEGTQATINEGFWRLGGGVAVRLQENSLDRNRFFMDVPASKIENTVRRIGWNARYSLVFENGFGSSLGIFFRVSHSRGIRIVGFFSVWNV